LLDHFIHRVAVTLEIFLAAGGGISPVKS
jgi:hypothetical protein